MTFVPREQEKEQEGLAFVRDFLRAVVGVEAVDIEGKRNMTEGDLELPGGARIEVKRQPISPASHPLNFVEVGELNPRCPVDTGYRDMCETLGMLPSVGAVRRTPRGERVRELGRITNSLQGIAGSDWTFYCNPPDGWMYAYQRDELLFLTARACIARTVSVGAGNSHDRTLGVTIPLPAQVWKRTRSAHWFFCPRGRWESMSAPSTVMATLFVSQLRDRLGVETPSSTS